MTAGLIALNGCHNHVSILYNSLYGVDSRLMTGHGSSI